MRSALLGLIVVLVLPAAAGACGMPLEATVPSEQALITYADGREEIVASLALENAGPDAAVVFPVPADATVDVLEGEEDLFAYLANVTNLVELDGAGGSAPGSAGAAPREKGVEVVSREEIGGYDVATLRANDPGALSEYLDANGYRTPPGAEPILAEYVKEGWSYVAVKLADETPTDGELRPLRIAFPSERMVYPKRLDALAEEPVATTIYVLADERVEIDELTEEYAGPVADLAPPPDEFKALFARAPYLTKLSSETLTDAQLERDFVFEFASAGAVVGPSDADGDGDGDETPWRTWLVGLLIGLGVVALIARTARRSAR